MWRHVELSVLFYPFAILKFSTSSFSKEKINFIILKEGKEGTNYSKITSCKMEISQIFPSFPHKEDQYNQTLKKKHKTIGFFKKTN